jgi:hypothetical protein
MYQFILMFHSGWRYVVLIVLFVALIKYIIGWIGKRQWSNLDTTLNRISPIALDIQWLLGVIIWISGTWWSNANSRIAWEHPVILTLAVVLSHVVARRVSGKTESADKYRWGTLGYIAVLALLGVGISAALGSWNLFA